MWKGFKKIKFHFSWKTLIAALVFCVLLAADLLTKSLQEKFCFHFDIIPGYISVVDVLYNYGISFSAFYGMYTLIKVITTILVVALLAVFLLVPEKYIITKISLSCIIAGALGNLIDRFMFNGVRDFIQDNLITHTTLNLADLFITIGVILIIIDMLFLNDVCVFPLRKKVRLLQAKKREEEKAKEEKDITSTYLENANEEHLKNCGQSITEGIADNNTENIAEGISEDIAEDITEDITESTTEGITENITDNKTENKPDVKEEDGSRKAPYES